MACALIQGDMSNARCFSRCVPLVPTPVAPMRSSGRVTKDKSFSVQVGRARQVKLFPGWIERNAADPFRLCERPKVIISERPLNSHRIILQVDVAMLKCASFAGPSSMGCGKENHEIGVRGHVVKDFFLSLFVCPLPIGIRKSARSEFHRELGNCLYDLFVKGIFEEFVKG